MGRSFDVNQHSNSTTQTIDNPYNSKDAIKSRNQTSQSFMAQQNNQVNEKHSSIDNTSYQGDNDYSSGMRNPNDRDSYDKEARRLNLSTKLIYKKHADSKYNSQVMNPPSIIDQER